MTDDRPIIRPASASKGRYRRSDLRDHAFYVEHAADIRRAVKEGDIIEDDPTWSVDRSIGRRIAQEAAEQAAVQTPAPSFDATGSSPAKPRGSYRYNRRDLRDTDFYAANRDDILAASARGDIDTDAS